MTEYHGCACGGGQQQGLISHSSGGREPEIQVWAGRVSPRPLSLARRHRLRLVSALVSYKGHPSEQMGARLYDLIVL